VQEDHGLVTSPTRSLPGTFGAWFTNLHRAAGLHKPFVSLITNDGYRVSVNGKPFSEEILAPHQVVIANAQGGPGSDAAAANAAFTAAECQAVDAWVRAGGSLLYRARFRVTAHAPWPLIQRQIDFMNLPVQPDFN
jgi:hypothetical protein